MKTKAILSVLVLLAVYCPLTTVHCFSAVPSLINYQGVLKDSDGVPYNGNATIVFSIWNDSTGGNKLWEETQAIVSVSHGLFNVLLGSSNPIPDSVFLKPSAWLQVIANGNQLSPRRQIVSVGYAFHSGFCDTALNALTAPPDDDWETDTSSLNIFRMTGNVGIGTTNPQHKLHVFGTQAQQAKIEGNGQAARFVLDGDTGTGADLIYQVNGNSVWGMGWNPDYEGIVFMEDDDNYKTRMIIKDNGNIGIGTTSPAHKLDVEGYVQAYGYYTGDIIFQKDKEKLWRMFEDEEGLYLENLKTGKIYRFILQEMEKK
jgi:hypothetical protein